MLGVSHKRVVLDGLSNPRLSVNWLNNFNKQSPSSENTNSSTSPEILRTVWNLKVHSCFQDSRPFVSILNHINPVLNFQPIFLKIPFNIILPSTTRSINYSLSLWFSHQNSKCIALTRLWYHMPCRQGVAFVQAAVRETASRYGEKLGIRSRRLPKSVTVQLGYRAGGKIQLTVKTYHLIKCAKEPLLGQVLWKEDNLHVSENRTTK
jgi:hypothetical protein